MNPQTKKFFIPFIVCQILMFTFVFCYKAPVSGEEERIIKIIDPNTGLANILLGSEDQPLPPEGYTFTVNVTLEGTTSLLYNYQVGIKFDPTKLRCVTAWLPKNDPNFIFYGKSQIVSVNPEISNAIGYVAIGASLVGTDNVNKSQGILCQINFTAIKTGAFILEHIGIESQDSPYYGLETYLWNVDMVDIDFTPASFSINVLAAPSPPIASFTYTPSEPKANVTITFDASASFDPDGDIVSYFWDFGDGTNETHNETPPLYNTTHTYLLNGVYLVNLTVTDNDGNNGSTTQEVLVGGIPYASFTYDWERKDEFPDNPYREITVTFNATDSYDPDTRSEDLPNGNITLYKWNFTLLRLQAEETEINYVPVKVNETTTNETLCTWVFAENGVYHVTLTVFDNEGLSNSTTQLVFVGHRPIVNFTASNETPMPDEEVIFNAYGTETQTFTYDPDGFIVYSVWDFGDLTLEAYNISELGENYLIRPHTYVSQGGDYFVNLTVFDDEGLYSSAGLWVNVTIVSKEVITGVGWEVYATVGTVFGAVIVLTVWYKKRPEKELPRSERYRVI